MKNGSASGTKLDESTTERLVPLRFGVDGLVAGAAWVAAGAAGAVVAAGCAAGAAAGAVVAAGFGASVGFASAGLASGCCAAGDVAPPQAVSNIRVLVPPASFRNPRRVSPR